MIDPMGNRGHLLALWLASTSLGVRKVTEEGEHLVVEFGQPEAPRPSLTYFPDHYVPEATRSRGPVPRKRYPRR